MTHSFPLLFFSHTNRNQILISEMTDICKKQIRDVDDDESLPDQPLPKNKNYSRNWIMRDASYRLPVGEPKCSTMKDTYRYPEAQKIVNIGKKKAMLLKQFEEEAQAEILRENFKPPVIEEYCTVYDTLFTIPGFRVDDDYYKKEKDLDLKYPLYASTPTSYYSFNLAKTDKVPKEILNGHTKTTNQSHPFRRCGAFTKPLGEVFDTEIR